MKFILLLLLIILYKICFVKEGFKVLEEKRYIFDTEEFVRVAKTNITYDKDINNFAHKNIILMTETTKENLEKVEFIIHTFLDKLNKFSKNDWELLEIISFTKTGNEFNIKLFISNKEFPLNLEVSATLTPEGLKFNMINLFTNFPEFKFKGFDKLEDNNFEITNSLGLLAPFSTSGTGII